MNGAEESLEKISTFILLNNSKDSLKASLAALLTPKEITELATRIEIVKLLKQGVAQHKIAKKLGVGVATVTRGAKELKNGKFDQVTIENI